MLFNYKILKRILFISDKIDEITITLFISLITLFFAAL